MTFDPRILESCAIATGVSAVSLMALLPLGRRLGLVDRPDQGRKRHAFSTPLVGGLAIAIGMLAGWWHADVFTPFEDAVIWTTLMLVVVGVADDLLDLRVGVRVVAELGAIAIVVILGALFLFGRGS